MSVINDKGENHVLDKGDAIYIPENETHIVKNILEQPSKGIDIFVPGRSFDFWLKRK
jgi:quercetin dioxygenase-like cupin family protein